MSTKETPEKYHIEILDGQIINGDIPCLSVEELMSICQLSIGRFGIDLVDRVSQYLNTTSKDDFDVVDNSNIRTIKGSSCLEITKTIVNYTIDGQQSCAPPTRYYDAFDHYIYDNAFFMAGETITVDYIGYRWHNAPSNNYDDQNACYSYNNQKNSWDNHRSAKEAYFNRPEHQPQERIPGIPCKAKRNKKKAKKLARRKNRK